MSCKPEFVFEFGAYLLVCHGIVVTEVESYVPVSCDRQRWVHSDVLWLGSDNNLFSTWVRFWPSSACRDRQHPDRSLPSSVRQLSTQSRRPRLVLSRCRSRCGRQLDRKLTSATGAHLVVLYEDESRTTKSRQQVPHRSLATTGSHMDPAPSEPHRFPE
jgi:hypothetical protein